MTALLRATWLLYRTHLARTLFTRRMLLVVLGGLIPATVALLALRSPKPPPAVETFLFPGWMLIVQLFVPLAAVIGASAVVAEEVEDRTLTYLVTRPIPRPAILLGRWLAVASWLVVLTAACVGGLALAVRTAASALPPERALPEGSLPAGLASGLLAIAVLGVLAYSALFAALSTAVRHPLIVGLAFVFAIEGVLANLPGRSQAWTIQFQLRSLLLASEPELWGRIAEVRGFLADPAPTALATLAAVTVGALVVGSLVIRRRQYLSGS